MHKYIVSYLYNTVFHGIENKLHTPNVNMENLWIVLSKRSQIRGDILHTFQQQNFPMALQVKIVITFGGEVTERGTGALIYEN